VTLGPHDDYRLILGTQPGTTLHIESVAIRQDGVAFGFGRHDERLYARLEDLSGAVLGQHDWIAASANPTGRQSFTLRTATGPPETLVFAAEDSSVYGVGNISRAVT
jgi:hypothetical protein